MFLMGWGGVCFKLKRDINVRENGSWLNEKMRTISLISPQQVGGEINYLHEDGCMRIVLKVLEALILLTVNNCESTASWMGRSRGGDPVNKRTQMERWETGAVSTR